MIVTVRARLRGDTDRVLLAILAPTSHEMPTKGLKSYDMIRGMESITDCVSRGQMGLYEEDRRSRNSDMVDKAPHRACPLPDGVYQALRIGTRLESGHTRHSLTPCLT